jgi:hypothetical protein
MMKKIIVGIALLALFTIPLTGCSQIGSPNSVPASPAENAGDSSSIVVQSGLPLKVTEPADGTTINGGTVTVKGQTAPGATVTVNDQADVADENGNFSIAISLSQGVNAIDVIATNDSGNEGEILLMVNVVTGP